MLLCWRCRLTALFFLFRVCVKKSTQERLALKILIDRPKARNEVRGNLVTLLSDVCCLWLSFQYVCCHLNHSSSVLYCLGVSWCREIWFCFRPLCHLQPFFVMIQRLTHTSEAQSENSLQTLNCENRHWRADFRYLFQALLWMRRIVFSLLHVNVGVTSFFH